MTITKAQLDAEIEAQFPTNNIKAISAQKLRVVLDDMVSYTAQQGEINLLPAGTAAVGTEVGPFIQGGVAVQLTTQQISGTNRFVKDVGSDIGADLNSFMADISDNKGGGIVFLPSGNFLTSVPIVVPEQVVLRGSGKRTTSLTATSGFPNATPIVRIGRVTDVPTFDTRLEDILIDAFHIIDSIGVYSHDAAEGCGCFRVIVRNFRNIGIWYDQNCQNFKNEDLEIFNTVTSNNYCVKVSGA